MLRSGDEGASRSPSDEPDLDRVAEWAASATLLDG
jgi:hypothetical protein